MATHGRMWNWVPASYSRLEQVERSILEKNIASDFEMTKIARLGTVIVPCTDQEKRRKGEAKSLVLIHGFAGGNAMWATVRERIWA